MRKSRSKLRKVLPIIAGLALSANAYGQASDSALESFDYASHRNVPAIDGKCHAGEIHSYSLLPDATIAELNKNGVKILPMWFYDIDNDGKFGTAEADAIKRGIPIFMHEEFNKIANAKVRKFLEIAVEYNSLQEKMEQESKNSKEGNEKLRADYEVKKSKLEEDILRLEADILELRKDYSAYDSSVQKILEKPSQEHPLPLSETPARQKKEKGYTLVSLIAQGDSNFAFDAFGGSLGARINPFKNKKIGLGALLDFNFSLDRQIDSYSSPLSAGRTAYGTVTDTNNFSIGLSAEAQLGAFILGAGADYSNWIRKTVEQILDSSGNIIKSNTNSLTDSGITGKVYGGVEIPLTDTCKLGATVGYSGKNGPYFGIRSVFRLNQNKK